MAELRKVPSRRTRRWHAVHNHPTAGPHDETEFWSDVPGYDAVKHATPDGEPFLWVTEGLPHPGMHQEHRISYSEGATWETEELLRRQEILTLGQWSRVRQGSAPLNPKYGLPTTDSLELVWDVVRFLTYEESRKGYSVDPTGVVGYDPSKSHADEAGEPTYYTITTDRPNDPELGHFFYFPRYKYFGPSEAVYEEPDTWALTVDIENHIEMVVPAYEALTYLFWEPLDYQLDAESNEDDNVNFGYVAVEDMDTAYQGRGHHIIGTMTNKIILTTATDPANYDVDEWDGELGKFALTLRRHGSIPGDLISAALANPAITEVIITGVRFETEGVLKVATSDSMLNAQSKNFKVPAGGYRLMACGSARQQKGEAVTLDLWPSDNPDGADEILKIKGVWGRSLLYPPDPRSSYYDH